jgi:hypothetical protein
MAVEAQDRNHSQHHPYPFSKKGRAMAGAAAEQRDDAESEVVDRRSSPIARYPRRFAR